MHGECEAIVINPTLAGNSKKKADKYDATLLSYHGLTGVWEKSCLPSGLQHDLTVVSRRVIKATQAMTRATNAIGTRLLDENLHEALPIVTENTVKTVTIDHHVKHFLPIRQITHIPFLNVSHDGK